MNIADKVLNLTFYSRAAQVVVENNNHEKKKKFVRGAEPEDWAKSKRCQILAGLGGDTWAAPVCEGNTEGVRRATGQGLLGRVLCEAQPGGQVGVEFGDTDRGSQSPQEALRIPWREKVGGPWRGGSQGIMCQLLSWRDCPQLQRESASRVRPEMSRPAGRLWGSQGEVKGASSEKGLNPRSISKTKWYLLVDNVGCERKREVRMTPRSSMLNLKTKYSQRAKYCEYT